ncbi:hypothetical protein BJ875DRAFT_525634 [Amylocarpus encephaloides]|uniref:BTB domain-containing protein n=1 Tax=Amylocarpus encephaloides TaxID=45428 RepID=A0A9P7Y8J1_9HELO|nr:hypothetical protein BJ875DRAFT_525634 [Amylocarpus encephaloides]
MEQSQSVDVSDEFLVVEGEQTHSNNAALTDLPTPLIFSATTRQHTDLFKNYSGDIGLIMTVNGHKISTKASTQVLSLASPVWSQVIQNYAAGKFNFMKNNQELSNHEVGARGGTSQHLDFTEDNTEALTVLLNIAHLDFGKVPRKELCFSKLLNLAKLVAKYKCLSLVEPFYKNWLEGEDFEPFQDGHENWLFIAYVFGRHAAFAKLTKKIAKEVRVNKDGSLIDSLGQLFKDPMPHGILESIQEVRETTIKNTLDIWYHYVDSLIDSQTISCKLGKADCDELAFGKIVMALKQLNLWPAKTEIDLSVNDLADKLKGFSFGALGKGHEGCHEVSEIQRLTVEVAQGIPSPILYSHYSAMTSACMTLNCGAKDQEYDNCEDLDF